jgi:hypothetical protein
MALFKQYVGVDYSGAKTAGSRLSGLRVYVSSREEGPTEAHDASSPSGLWSRRNLAAWLITQISGDQPTLVGIDHGFSFPLQYFDRYRLAHNWVSFLEDFQRHWPTDNEQTSVDLVRKGLCGNGSGRSGDARWRRLTERRAKAKSVFHFDVPGSVAKSTHAGLPWLRSIRLQVPKVHFWPFDSWDLPLGRSAIVEIYPSLWSRELARESRNDDQHDAFSASSWMRRADRDGTLASFLCPELTDEERNCASIEGWILGIK